MRSGTVDIVFANEHEAMSLYQTASLETAINTMAEECALAIVTMGERGSVVARKNERASVEAIEIKELVDLRILLGKQIPFDAQTLFFQALEAATPEVAEKLGLLRVPLGFTAQPPSSDS